MVGKEANPGTGDAPGKRTESIAGPIGGAGELSGRQAGLEPGVTLSIANNANFKVGTPPIGGPGVWETPG